MSFFIAGELLLDDQKLRPQLTITDFLFSMAEGAIQKRVCVIFGANISQKLVLEILDYDCNSEKGGVIPFLITASPAENSSDEILFPREVDQTTSGYRDHLKNRLESIREIVAEAVSKDFVSGISLTFASAFDASYPTQICEVADMADIAYESIRQNGFFSSFRLVMRSGVG